jgi:hypothetical protein
MQGVQVGAEDKGALPQTATSSQVGLSSETLGGNALQPSSEDNVELAGSVDPWRVSQEPQGPRQDAGMQMSTGELASQQQGIEEQSAGSLDAGFLGEFGRELLMNSEVVTKAEMDGARTAIEARIDDLKYFISYLSECCHCVCDFLSQFVLTETENV